MTKTATVTIGIPAYNEQANIEHLLRSVLRQKQNSFTLEHIVVISDGSKDKTVWSVRKIAAQSPIITLVDERERKGKVARLEQLYQMNASDILVTLDADVSLANKQVISELVAVFARDQKACLAVAHQVPVKPETTLGKIVYAGHRLWDEVRADLQRGNNIHNMYGAACALRKDFAKSVHFPHAAMCDTGFLYVLAWQRNGFRYAKKAEVLYRVASSWQEYRTQSLRTMVVDKRVLVDHFGNWVKELYHVPVSNKVEALAKMLWRHPVSTSMTVALGAVMRLSLRKESAKRTSRWNPLASTKQPISRV